MLFQTPAFAAAAAEVHSADVLSFDVFDTILMRRAIGERERLWRAANKVEQRSRGRIDALTYFTVRRQAQHLGYRAIDVGGKGGDLRLDDMLAKVVLLLGCPADFAVLCRAAELEVEHLSVRLNRPLAQDMRQLKAAGKRIIAVSDTPWSAHEIAALIEAKLGAGIIDRFYSSADEGLTKRAGGLFRRVLIEEQRPAPAFLHIGDDRLADVEQARRAGIRALHAERPQAHLLVRRIRYLRVATGRFVADSCISRRGADCGFSSRQEVGEKVLGPIAADLCRRLWLYLSYQPPGSAAALFCARGGLAIDAMLTRFLARTGLPLEVPRARLMISRITALRVAFMRDAPSARMEMTREFQGRTCGHAGMALSGLLCNDAPGWTGPFDYGRFRALLAGTEHGHRALSEIILQAERLERHLRQVSGGAARVILCDTGLYGSTGRFLKEGLPHLGIESVLAARCDYKHLGRDHFGYTTGLVTEANGYAPWDVRSSILRYWQLMEELCEVDLASVRNYCERADGTIISNLEVPGWQDRLTPTPGSMLFGVMRYLDQLQPGDLGILMQDAEQAWSTLRRVIVGPRREHIAVLGDHDRSVDFGDDSIIPVIPLLAPAPTWSARMRSVRGALWREGAITSQFPRLRLILLPSINGIYGLRAVKRQVSETVGHSAVARSLRTSVKSAARRVGLQVGGDLSSKRV